MKIHFRSVQRRQQVSTEIIHIAIPVCFSKYLVILRRPESLEESPVVDENCVVRQFATAEYSHDVSELIIGHSHAEHVQSYESTPFLAGRTNGKPAAMRRAQVHRVNKFQHQFNLRMMKELRANIDICSELLSILNRQTQQINERIRRSVEI
jgi:hypothetical protein